MAITLTERAAKEVQTIAGKSNLKDPCLRVAVKGGGCSGFTYLLDLCDGPADGDEVFTQNDIRVVCDPKSYLYVNGTEIDFKDELMGRGFVFNNPNAKGVCGCGSSFQA
jgi:iron-sulfur cluster assembly protein